MGASEQYWWEKVLSNSIAVAFKAEIVTVKCFFKKKKKKKRKEEK